MASNSQRQTRPVPEPAQAAITSPTGMNRQRLAMTLSIAALLVSLASAGVHLFTFFAGGRDLMKSQTTKNEFDAKISAVEAKWTDKMNALQARLTEAETKLREEQGRTQRTEQERNRAQASLAATQQVSAEVDARVQREVVQPAIPLLHDSAVGAASGKFSPLAPKNPRGQSSEVDALGPKQGRIR